MKKRIKVCWYCEKWQPGGIQAVQVNLIQHMDLNTIDFDIVVSEDDTKLFDDTLSNLGIKKIVTLDKKYKSPGRRVLTNIFEMNKLLRKENYDVVHFNACHGVELIYVFLAWLHRVPKRIVHCRNNDIGAGGKFRKIKIICHHICKKVFGLFANVRLANSDLAAEWLFGKKQLQKGRVQILKNGIDANKYAFDMAKRIEMRENAGLTNKLVIGHIGHFSYQKNHDFLLKVFESILKSRDDAILLLIGSGDGESEIRHLSCELGIERKIIFWGVTNDVPAVLNMMDVFVFPSRFEGFGNVLIEAQASGLDCFASEDVIPKAVEITNRLHWISLEKSYDDWADIVLNNMNIRLRKSNVEQVISAGYDISNMAKNLEKIYCR